MRGVLRGKAAQQIAVDLVLVVIDATLIGSEVIGTFAHFLAVLYIHISKAKR